MKFLADILKLPDNFPLQNHWLLSFWCWVC